jgi:hypothetical protein
MKSINTIPIRSFKHHLLAFSLLSFRFRTLRLSSRFAFAGLLALGSIRSGVSVGLVNRLSDFADVLRGFAFGANRVRVDPGSVSERQTVFGML